MAVWLTHGDLHRVWFETNGTVSDSSVRFKNTSSQTSLHILQDLTFVKDTYSTTQKNDGKRALLRHASICNIRSCMTSKKLLSANFFVSRVCYSVLNGSGGGW